MRKDEVIECLKLLESEYNVPAGVLRPNDKLKKLFHPVRATTPWQWLVYRTREGDSETEINYELGKRTSPIPDSDEHAAGLKFKFGNMGGDIAGIEGKNVTLDSNRFTAQGANLAFVTNITESIVQGALQTSFELRTLTVTGSTFGAFVLLHELGHRTKIYGKYDKDGSKYNNLPTGVNNEKIRAACFGELQPY